MIYRVESRIEKYLEDFKNAIVANKIPLNVSYSENEDTKAKKIFTGFVWGGPDKRGYFEIDSVIIPDNWRIENFDIGLDIELSDFDNKSVNPESLIFINGKPLQGYDKNHKRVVIPKDCIKKGNFNLKIDAFSGLRAYTNTFLGIDLILIDKSAISLYYLVSTAYETAKTFTKDEYARDFLLSCIDKAVDKIDWRLTDYNDKQLNFDNAREFLVNIINEKQIMQKRPEIICTGHSHIDVAWYWQVKHTRQKCKRTFSTALRLMDLYPDYTFFQSQAQLYDFIRQDAPDIFDSIKKQVKSGKWQVEGGMWVEADCNISSGESLVRQFLYGKKFYKEHFDVECEILWLPDAFGYNANLPQIMAKSNIKYFVTTKIGWNQFVRPQYDTFRWFGIDNSSVLATFLPIPEHPDDEDDFAYSYNARISPKVFKRMWKNYRHIDLNPNKLLMTVGHGDGGGGTEPSMLETIKATQQIPFGPVCKMGNVKEYLEELDQTVKENPMRTPEIKGELYLEMHRGTYTSQSKNKFYNRKMENIIHDIEQMYSLYAFDTYPKARIDSIWETILLNQFHDILPGSSIRAVHKDSIDLYEIAMEKSLDLIKILMSKWLYLYENKDKTAAVLYNTLAFERDEIIELPASDSKYRIDDQEILSQEGFDIDENKMELALVENIKPATPIFIKKDSLNKTKEEKSQIDNCIINFEKNILESKYFIISFDKDANITSIIKKYNNEEYIKKGCKANKLTAYEDRPGNFDAWDIEHWYKQKPYDMDELLFFEIIENGPVRGCVKIKYKYQNSIIEQRMYLYNHTHRIDFENKIDWHEHQTLLKVDFPFDINATEATFDIQFGNVKRPTHQNTISDFAKFEVPAHKWADISQRNKGASLLNDCKYGYHANKNILGLTLIKSGIVPDEMADQGEHKFTYSLYLHDGDWVKAKTNEQAYMLNLPLQIFNSDELEKNNNVSNEKIESIIPSIEISGVILESIKKSENNEGIILRLYEYTCSSTDGEIKFNIPIKEAFECDLMENKIEKLETYKERLNLNFSTYEIKTILVIF